MQMHLAAYGDALQDARKRCTDALHHHRRSKTLPSNSRNAKTIPPIIAAAKSAIATLKQLHRAAAVDLLASVRPDAGRQRPVRRNTGRTAR